MAYNRNVLVTAPLLVMLAAKDALTVLRKVAGVSGEDQE
jgi:hypothetical protein